MFSIDLNI